MKATQQHEQHKGKSGGPGVGEGVEEGEDITKFGRRIPFFNAPKVASVSVTDEQQRAAFESPSATRQRVLHETLRRLGTPRKRRLYRATALDNLKRWARAAKAAKAAKAAPKGCGGGGGNKAASEDASSPSPSSAFTSSSASAGVTVTVLPGDWGTVTQQVTKEHGKMFAVLNMANAYVFGGLSLCYFRVLSLSVLFFQPVLFPSVLTIAIRPDRGLRGGYGSARREYVQKVVLFPFS